VPRRRVLSIATLYPNAANPRFGTFVARQLEALAARDDWDVTVINPIGVPPLAFGRYRGLKAAAVDGFEQGVHVFRPRFSLIPLVGARRNADSIVNAVLPLARRLHAAAPFDLVDAQFFFPDGPAATRIATALGLPLSIKARGADIQFWGKKPWAREAMLAAGAQAARLLAVSEALAGDMAALGLPREKIAIHYTGLDRDLFRPRQYDGLRAELGKQLGLPLANGEILLASVGALIPRKGQEFAIRALAQLDNARLLLVGMGEDEAKLRALAKRLGVGDRVHFLGSIDHDFLPLVLSAADAMVLPSRSEGLANAWVEALACGTPLVICDAGGARELLRDPSAGRIVARDPQAIATAVREIHSARPSPEAVAANAAAFSWEANAAALAQYYEGLLAS
jgi:glycosyltransferase involved in cell wall biosynthesis